MKTIRFSESILINSDPDTVFNYTQNYNTRLNWDTFLIKAELIENATEAGKGVRALCVAKNGIGMITEYVSFQKPKVAAIKMTKGPFMFSSFQASWNFKPTPNNQTEVTFLYSFSLRFPFNLFSHFIKANLINNVQQRLRDLKHNIEL